MKCIEREDLFAYVHRMLELRDEEKVRAHIELCPRCQEAVEEFRKLDAVLEEWKSAEPSPWFDARVRAAVAASKPAEPPRVFFGLQWGRWLAPALVGVLVVVGSLVVLRLRQPHEVPQPVARQEAAKPVTPAPPPAVTPAVESEADELSLYQNLPVLEDYDMLADFEVLSEIPKGAKKVVN